MAQGVVPGSSRPYTLGPAYVILKRPCLSTPLAGHTDYINALAFSPDGHTLASGSRDQTARLWEMNVDQATQRICTTTTNTLTPTKSEHYVSPDLPYRPPY